MRRRVRTYLTKMTVSKLKVAYIEWLDHQSVHNGWEKMSEVQTMTVPRAQSFGFVIYEDNDQVILSPTVADDECNMAMQILKNDIIKRKNFDPEKLINGPRGQNGKKKKSLS